MKHTMIQTGSLQRTRSDTAGTIMTVRQAGTTFRAVTRDNDVRFVFVLLYRDPESLSEKEMYDMWFHNFTSSH